jgi:[ribosomal protein S5]-alanine N-acetyltransferase
MAFLRISSGSDVIATLTGRGIYMRPPLITDYAAWARLRAASRDFLTPWEPYWPHDDLTSGGYRRRIRHYQREARDDLGYAFSLFDQNSNELVGGVTLSNVRRGVAQSANLGYWIGQPFAGRGYMSEAVRALIPYAFDVLRLHRLEAATQPTNAASMRVLERNGFVKEGLARSYLKIDGRWQDHVLFGLVAGAQADAERLR